MTGISSTALGRGLGAAYVDADHIAGSRITHNYLILLYLWGSRTVDISCMSLSPSAYRKRICSNLCALQRGSVHQILPNQSKCQALLYAAFHLKRDLRQLSTGTAASSQRCRSI